MSLPPSSVCVCVENQRAPRAPLLLLHWPLLLQPHQRCLVDCYPLSLRQLQYFSLQPCSLHLFSTRPPGQSLKQRNEGVACSNDSDYLWQSPNSPALFSRPVTYSRPSTVWPQASSVDPCGSTCHQRHRHRRLTPHSPAYSVIFSPSLPGCGGKYELWNQPSLGFIPVIALLSMRSRIRYLISLTNEEL